LNENGANGSVDYQFGLSMLSATGSTFEQFYQRDGVGSIATVTDAAGSSKASYAYDPWGRMLNPIDPLGNKNSFKFTGEVLDSTGLYYLRARYYDPSVGSFISKDPYPGFAMVPTTQNRYSYARNRPAVLVDRSGLSGQIASSEAILNGQINGDFEVFVSGPTAPGATYQPPRSTPTTPNYLNPFNGFNQNPFGDPWWWTSSPSTTDPFGNDFQVVPSGGTVTSPPLGPYGGVLPPYNPYDPWDSVLEPGSPPSLGGPTGEGGGECSPFIEVCGPNGMAYPHLPEDEFPFFDEDIE
jgi:RHS repeat-associated protein